MGPVLSKDKKVVNGRAGLEPGSPSAQASDLFQPPHRPVRGPADSGLRLAGPKMLGGMLVWATEKQTPRWMC